MRLPFLHPQAPSPHLIHAEELDLGAAEPPQGAPLLHCARAKSHSAPRRAPRRITTAVAAVVTTAANIAVAAITIVVVAAGAAAVAVAAEAAALVASNAAPLFTFPRCLPMSPHGPVGRANDARVLSGPPSGHREAQAGPLGLVGRGSVVELYAAPQHAQHHAVVVEGLREGRGGGQCRRPRRRP